MPIRNLITSDDDDERVIEATARPDGLVAIDITNLRDPYGPTLAAHITILPEDVPALCRELRRVAKLAKQGGGNGTRY